MAANKLRYRETKKATIYDLLDDDTELETYLLSNNTTSRVSTPFASSRHPHYASLVRAAGIASPELVHRSTASIPGVDKPPKLPSKTPSLHVDTEVHGQQVSGIVNTSAALSAYLI